MRILIATGIFPPDVGGPATYVPSFAAACVRRGHAVHVIAYGDPRGRDTFGFPVVSIPRWPLPFRYGLFFLACIRYGFSADVIFVQDGFSSGIPAFFASLALRRRLIVKIVGDAAWEYSRNSGMTDDTIDMFQNRTSYPLLIGAIRFFQRAVCRRSVHVIVPSEYLKGIVLGWGVDVRAVRVVPNSVPLPPLFPSVRRDPFLIFSAGRFVPWKGFAGLIRAFDALAPSYPHARLAIAGDGPCFPPIRLLASSRASSSRISFLGSLSPEDMSAWHFRAGCFVLFSEYEGMSHAILEALARRTPVIASDAGGNAELIAHGENGMLVPTRDPHALQGALRLFLSDPRAAIPHPGFRFPSPSQDPISMTCRLIESNS